MVQPCKRREIISKSSWLVMRATDNRKRGQIWAIESFGRSEQVEERGIKPKGMQDENLSQFSGAPEELQASQFEPFPLKPRNYFPDLSRIRNPENGRQTTQVSFHVTWTPYIHEPHFIPWGESENSTSTFKMEWAPHNRQLSIIRGMRKEEGKLTRPR